MTPKPQKIEGGKKKPLRRSKFFTREMLEFTNMAVLQDQAIKHKMTKQNTKWREEYLTKKYGLMDKLDELWPKGDKGRSKAMVFNAFAEMALSSQRQEILDSVMEKLKHHSANLPIPIERHGIYAQGMHAGLDLAIDEVITIAKSVIKNSK